MLAPPCPCDDTDARRKFVCLFCAERRTRCPSDPKPSAESMYDFRPVRLGPACSSNSQRVRIQCRIHLYSMHVSSTAIFPQQKQMNNFIDQLNYIDYVSVRIPTKLTSRTRSAHATICTTL